MGDAACYNGGGCAIQIYRLADDGYTITFSRSSTIGDWQGDECDYYDGFPAGEKICKSLEAQGNVFFACYDC